MIDMESMLICSLMYVGIWINITNAKNSSSYDQTTSIASTRANSVINVGNALCLQRAGPS